MLGGIDLAVVNDAEAKRRQLIPLGMPARDSFRILQDHRKHTI